MTALLAKPAARALAWREARLFPSSIAYVSELVIRPVLTQVDCVAFISEVVSKMLGINLSMIPYCQCQGSALRAWEDQRGC